MKHIPIQIMFKDRDGNLIMNRSCDASWFNFDESFIEISLAADARSRGVRILSHDYKYSCRHLVYPKSGGTISCVVEYLKRR